MIVVFKLIEIMKKTHRYFEKAIIFDNLLFSILMSSKVEDLKISQNSQENTCAGVSFLIRMQAEKLY